MTKKRLVRSLGIAMALVWAPLAQADYVATAVNRIFVDPASVPAIADGYHNGDVVSFIFETTPEITGGATTGAGAWATVYLPPGVEVIAAELVGVDSNGDYVQVPAKDIDTIQDNCGPRNCDIVDAAGATRMDDIILREGQQDSGIFYSTDAQTALLATALSRDPTGTPIQSVWNQWDANQIDAFGINTALSGNAGTGTTPAINYNSGVAGSWIGTGSPVAGPDTYHTNDYDPSCNGGNADSTAFQADLACVGPWQRIQYANSKIARSPSVPVAVGTAIGGGAATRANPAVLTTAGYVLSSSNPLPSGANAIRYVQGKRRVGDLELARVTLRITNQTTFVAALVAGNTFCLDATAGDNSRNDGDLRGAQDNVWRYYEGNKHTCFQADPNGLLVKHSHFLNGNPSTANALALNDIVGYDIAFVNNSQVPLTNLVMSDAIVSNLVLVAAGTAGCPFSSYAGTVTDPNGVVVSTNTPTFGSFGVGNTTATWNALASLAPGNTLTVSMCGRVTSSTSGAKVENEGRAQYSGSPLLSSSTLGTITSYVQGRTYCDVDGTGTITPSDTVVSNHNIELRNTSDVALSSSVTTPTGVYEFTSLTAATTYRLVDTGHPDLVSVAAFAGTGGTVINADRIDVVANATPRTGMNFLDRGPELQAAISNDAPGNAIVLPSSFNWTFAISNPATGSGGADAAFQAGEVLFSAQLPLTPTYGTVSIVNGGTPPTGTINCTISVGKLLSCVASTAVTLVRNASFSAVFQVTPTVVGTLNVSATVDPANAVNECVETNDFAAPVGVDVTVPVTLSDVHARVSGGQVLVDFGTAAEAGTLGFVVLEQRAGEAPVASGVPMIAGKGSTLDPQRYQAVLPARGQEAIWIEEIAIDGARTPYGPYKLGVDYGDRVLPAPVDWAAIGREQRSFRTAQTAAVRQVAGAALEAEVRISTDGVVQIRHEDLQAAGIDYAGRPARTIGVWSGMDRVPVEYSGPETFGPGSVLSFPGRAVQGSRYSATRLYRVRQGEAAAAWRPVHANPGVATGNTVVRATQVHAPNRNYDMTSAHSDPWYAQRMIRTSASVVAVEESFVLSDRDASSGSERLTVSVWGGIDDVSSPDHHFLLSLNGTQIGDLRFDGLVYRRVLADLPAGLLRTGSNTLRLELIPDTSAPFDVVYFDGIEVEYDRKLQAVADQIEFAGVAATDGGSSDQIYAHNLEDAGTAACSSNTEGCARYRIGGFSRSDLWVYRQDAAGEVRLSAVRIDPVGSGYEVSFADRAGAGARYRIEPRQSGSSAFSPRLPATDPIGSEAADLLIVSHPSFAAGLAPLVAARRAEGYAVRVVDVEDLYAAYSGRASDPDAISAALIDAQSRLGTRYVLLVGGDSYDYYDYLGVHSQSFVPTYYRATSEVIRHAPVDMPYADVDGDGRADLSLGRFPVRTQAELNALVAKTLAYPTATRASSLTWVADRSAQGMDFANKLQGFATQYGQLASQRSVALDGYTAGSSGLTVARNDLKSAVDGGTGLLTFFGHSAPATWARESLLTAAMVHGSFFANTSKPTMAWVLGCYGAYFVTPNYNAMSLALMVQANGGGAAAVIGSSGLTRVSSDMLWMDKLAPRLLTLPVGDALRDTQRELAASPGNRADVATGSMLLGDPTLRVQR